MSATTTGRRTALPTGAKWVQPVQGYGITTPYGKKGPMWSSGMHTGADFASPTGTTIRAVAAGRVKSVGDAGAYGNRTVIQHAPGFETWYCHQSATMVTPGQNVAAGQAIGKVGATGNVTGPHLHLEVRVNGAHRDPAPYLSGAAEAPASSSTPEYDTQPGTTNVARPTSGALGDGSSNAAPVFTNASLVPSAAGDEVRRLVLVVTVVLGGMALIAIGVAQGTQPARQRVKSTTLEAVGVPS